MVILYLRIGAAERSEFACRKIRLREGITVVFNCLMADLRQMELKDET